MKEGTEEQLREEQRESESKGPEWGGVERKREWGGNRESGDGGQVITVKSLISKLEKCYQINKTLFYVVEAHKMQAYELLKSNMQY